MNIQLALPQKPVRLFPKFVVIPTVKTQSNANLKKYGMNYNVIRISTY